MALCKETNGWPDKYGNGAEVIESSSYAMNRTPGLVSDMCLVYIAWIC
jgi:hypothetical protein